MADIDIQKKQRRAWPWLLGVALLALLVWVAIEVVEMESEVVVTDPVSELVQPAPAAVPAAPVSELDRYRAWVRDSSAALQQMGRDHEYASEGIERLAAAIEALVQRDTASSAALQQQLADLRAGAAAVTRDPTSPEHVSMVREAFLAAVAVLDGLQERRPLEDDAEGALQRAREQAESLDSGTPLLEQRQAVNAFFESMSTALQSADAATGRPMAQDTAPAGG